MPSEALQEERVSALRDHGADGLFSRKHPLCTRYQVESLLLFPPQARSPRYTKLSPFLSFSLSVSWTRTNTPRHSTINIRTKTIPLTARREVEHHGDALDSGAVPVGSLDLSVGTYVARPVYEPPSPVRERATHRRGSWPAAW